MISACSDRSEGFQSQGFQGLSCSSWALGQDLSSDTRLICNGSTCCATLQARCGGAECNLRCRGGPVLRDQRVDQTNNILRSHGAQGASAARGVYQFGFEKPSAIQQRAIAPIVQGRDVIAQAQSGTGKTSMIAVSLLQAPRLPELRVSH